ncbi:MAG: hypothetical protein SVO96_09830 [Pseudomonadota bacterium]|nr:hypothetical protein [Pseudomonadota bacterium]
MASVPMVEQTRIIAAGKTIAYRSGDRDAVQARHDAPVMTLIATPGDTVG